jgi:predicted  nucleic acid-binding Zn-ribbon protein
VRGFLYVVAEKAEIAALYKRIRAIERANKKLQEEIDRKRQGGTYSDDELSWNERMVERNERQVAQLRAELDERAAALIKE